MRRKGADPRGAEGGPATREGPLYLAGLAVVSDGRERTRGERVDPETLERARRGDPEALEAVLEEVAPRLIRLARRIAPDAGSAEDLAEEALYRGAARLRALREATAAMAWFRRILINLWRDRLRMRGRRDLLLDEIPEPAAPPSTDPVRRADARELRERVADAVRRLPPGQRLAIALRIDEGLGIREIARILDSTPDRVKANLWHARERLRRDLRDLLELPPGRCEEP